MRGVFGALAGIIVAVLVGCGGGGGSPTGQEKSGGGPPASAEKPGGGHKQVKLPNPCALLTPSEVESITGTAVGPGSPNDEVGGTGCSWASPQGNAVGRSVAITIHGPTELYSARQQFDQGKTEITEHPDEIKEIPGIGDGAYGVVSDLNGGTVVKVLKGDFYLTVNVGEADTKTEKHLQMATELAKKATARL